MAKSSRVAAGTAIVITGIEEVDRKLGKFEVKVQKKALRKATRAAAKLVMTSAKQLVPVDTGTLKKSVKTRALKRSRVKQGHQVTVGAGFFKGETFYGGFLEYGTKRMQAKPFLRPAMHNNEQKAKNEFRTAMKAAVDELG